MDISKIEILLSTKFAEDKRLTDNFVERVKNAFEELDNLVDIMNDDQYLKNKQIVLDTLSLYYKGDLQSAYGHLTEWWEGIKASAPIAYIKYADIWFKMRKKDSLSLKAFSSEDVFHIPFNKLGLVAPYRFSISGHPCLYMSRRLYTCWCEMDRPALHTFDSMGLRSNDLLKLVDLRLWKTIDPDDSYNNIYQQFLPICMACAFRAINRNDKFIPEYIFPQMLLSIINFHSDSDDSIMGVMYSSTRFDLEDQIYSTKIRNADCVAIPTKTMDVSKPLCTKLASIFKVSKPVNLMLLQIKNPQMFMPAMSEEEIASFWEEIDNNSYTDEEKNEVEGNTFAYIERGIGIPNIDIKNEY